MKAKKTNLSRLTSAALLTAMTTAATLIIRIPTPTKGYINLGDCVVNIGAWLLGPFYGAAAAAIGSALADIFCGYTVYAPATLVIKGLTAVTSYLVFAGIQRKTSTSAARITAAVCAETVMVAGYFLFEAALYGSFAVALTGAAANAVQGAAGAAISAAVYEIAVKRAVKGAK